MKEWWNNLKNWAKKISVKFLTLSYSSKASLSVWEQLRPMGDTLINPVRHSIKLPLTLKKRKPDVLIALI